jgi:ABC-type sugar transport system substrate-binding protein
MTDSVDHDKRFDRRRFVAGTAGVAAGVAVGSTPAWARRAADPRHEIAFAQPDTAFAGYPLLLHGVQEAAKKRGFTVLQSHANSKLDAQVNEINTWIGEKIGGIIVLPLDNNAMQPLIAKAHQNGVKFLDYSDKALPHTDGWVIFDNLQGAHLVGTWIGHWALKTFGKNQTVKVALLTHEIQKTGRDRIHGGLSAFQKIVPNSKVVARHEAVLAGDALPVFQSMLQANPDINVVFCIADDGCLGAERAFMQTHPSKERMSQMAIAGWDGTLPVFEKIVSGSVIRATGALDLVTVGDASANATIDAVLGKGPTRISVKYKLVDQGNPGLAKNFIKRYNAIAKHG